MALFDTPKSTCESSGDAYNSVAADRLRRAMESVCLRIKTTFFSRWLALPPAVPDIEVKTTSDTVTTRFVYTQPTPFNQWDEIEFQARQ